MSAVDTRAPEVMEASAAHRAPADEYEARIRDKLRRELGPMRALLEDERVQEIFVNPDGAIRVDRAGEARAFVGTIRPSQVATLLATVATTLGETIDAARPWLDGVLVLDGSRISGEIPPLVTAPSLRIRKHARLVRPLDWFVETGTLVPHHLERIREAILARRNIVIVGATAAGKTFLANSLLAEIARLCPSDRVLTIEDTAELAVASDDALPWVTTPGVDMQLMLRRALRATPDRIVIGEVRGGEAYQLLKMWGTGHGGGIATIHSDKGALDGLTRLERMCGESPECLGMGRDWIRELVGDVVHLLVNVTRTPEGRTIPRIVEVDGLDPTHGTYRTHVIEREARSPSHDRERNGENA